MASNEKLNAALDLYRKSLFDVLGIPEKQRQEAAQILDAYIDLRIEKYRRREQRFEGWVTHEDMHTDLDAQQSGEAEAVEIMAKETD